MRRGWRQRDLADAARLSPTIVSRIERGAGDTIPPRKLDAVAAAVGARTDLRLSWNGEALDRLLDAGHAALAEAVASILQRLGWEVVLEATFWIRGERGSIDLLAWHQPSRIVVVVEVKSVVPDIQAMLGSLDRKVRLGIAIARERGWDPDAVGSLLIIGESRTARRRVETHAATFAAALPMRAVAIRRWLAGPTPAVPVRGLWFLSAGHRVTARHRVSVKRPSARA